MATSAVALRPHVAILPSPGIGHLIPLAEFAKILVHRHGFAVTFITVEKSPQVESLIDALPPAVTSVPLSTPSLDDLPPGCKAEVIICLTMARSRPSLHRVLWELKATTRLVAFVTDLFGVDTFDVAREFGLPKYVFFPTNAMVLQLFHHLRELDETNECEYRDMAEPTKFPGCVPVHGRDFLVPLQDRKDMAYPLTLHVTKRYDEADGIIVNTCAAIEREAIEAFNRPGLPEWKLQPVGPLVQAGPYPEDRFDSIKWLDKQPAGSVLFVSFGSGGVLSLEQLTELATGLEMSGQRFLWVVRTPSAKKDATFFTGTNGEDPLSFLPAGFLERTEGVGLVVPNWAPQISVLSHEAMGGFLSHCGWNSTMESLLHGVPLIAWPLYAEQRMNAVMLTEKVKVAIRPKEDDELIDRGEISRVVSALMEGEEGKEVRSRVKEFQEEMVKGLAVGGSSYVQLEEIANRWKNSAATAAVDANNGIAPVAATTIATA